MSVCGPRMEPLLLLYNYVVRYDPVRSAVCVRQRATIGLKSIRSMCTHNGVLLFEDDYRY